MKKVSIIVPVYNVEKYLARCVDSILKQTVTDFQLILVDDGSPDNCPKLCDDYAADDSRIYVIHRKNGGLSAARNSAIEWIMSESPTEWTTFIDSDDYINVRYLEVLLNIAKKSGNSIIVSPFFFTTSEHENIFYSPAEEYRSLDVQSAFVDQTINSCSACGRLFKTEDFANIRFPVGKVHEDRFTTYKIFFKYKKVSIIDEALYYCFDNPDSITRENWSVKRLDDLEACENQIKFFKENGFKIAYLFTMRSYGKLIIYSIKQAKKLKYKSIVKRLTRKIRRIVVFHAKEIDLDKNEDIDFYKYSFPTFYRIKRRIIK